MYNYSPLSKIYVKNFRNIGEAELSFSESPIIALFGENEAGKTSIIKAVSVCALHANPREHKDYIRDGTKMFGVAIELEDGNRIVRIKEENGVNAYQIFKDKNLIWNANKLSEGLPEEVRKLMGLIEEPETGEFLHVRTYEDKLLFVVTPASTNYKVMYNALKVEQLTKAIKSGSTEVNSLKSSISSAESSIQTLTLQSRDIQILDIEPLINVRNSLKEQMSILDKLEHAKELKDRITVCNNQLGALVLIDKFKLCELNELTTSKLMTAGKLLNKLSSVTNLLSIVNESNNIGEINTVVIDRLKDLYNKNNSLKAKIDDAGSLTQLTSLADISEVCSMHLTKVYPLLNKLDSLNKHTYILDIDNCEYVDNNVFSSITTMAKIDSFISSISSKQAEVKTLNESIGQINNYIKQCGVAFETCPKCGESVIFDVDKVEG